MNLLKDIGSGAWQVLKTVAPTIADTAAGPFAPLVDPIVRKIFGTNDPKQVGAALLNTTPDQLLALKQADNEHAENLVKYGIERDKLAFDNIANARAREIAVHDNTPKVLAYTVTVGFFSILTILIFHGVPKDGGGEALLVMLGALATAWVGIQTYYYGSSAGSAAKSDTLSRIVTSKS